MANFLGTNEKILTEKLSELVDQIDYVARKENNMAIITSVLAMSANPAYQAALITALKSSGRIDTIKDEIQNPSFLISDHQSEVSNSPAVFTESYQPSDEFVDNTIESTIPANSTLAFNIKTLIVKRGSSIFAKIVSPP